MNTSIARRAVLPAALVCALAASGCGAANEQSSGGDSGGGTGLSGEIQGAGASTQKVAQEAWIAKFTARNENVSMSYAPIGSGGGRKRFVSGAATYAGSDEPLQADELAQAKQRCKGKLIEMPVYISPIAVAYNLPGVRDLHLPPQTLAGIFTGKITRWNDPAVQKANPSAKLPNRQITPVHRSDESGTSGNFTDYLGGAAPRAWRYGSVEQWPSQLKGESAQGTSGVVKVAQQTPGAITYADASQVRQNKALGAARVKVGNQFVGPSPQAAAKILADSKRTGKDENVLTYDLNRRTSASGTYPVVLASYGIACGDYGNAATTKAVKQYLRYITSAQGQRLAAQQAGSAPLTGDLRSKEKAIVDSIAAG